MRRKGVLIWFVVAFSVVCLALVGHRQTSYAQSYQAGLGPKHLAIIPQRQQPHEAILTDATLLSYICSSRPERILPVQGTRGGRIFTPPYGFYRQYDVKQYYSYHDSRCRLESTPFCMSNSCDYYVFALKHILC